MELKKNLLERTESALEFFRAEDLDKKQSYALAKELSALVNEAIDSLLVVKNATEYTFHSSIKDALDKYFAGIKTNPKELARYNRQQAKYDARVAKGKTPDWKVVPPALVDLELARKNVRSVLHNLRATYRNAIETESKFDSRAEMIALIDYLKEQASAVVYRITKKMAKAKALKLLEEVGIPEPAIRYNQYPFEFSGGMRQRIVIAIALAANPDILICDEPTTALDVTIQSQILELINRIKAERNLSVIFITHDLGVVANMADRIAVMYAGKIVEYGTADDVFYDPRHPYTWALLASMPDLDTKEKLEAIPGTPPNMIFPPKGDAFASRNKYAMEIDFEEEPPMFQVSDTHFAATWLLHPNAPKVAPPKIVTDRIERMSKEVK
ncbi:MAG: ATP-binding cassette domain-containing protein [Corallococcus sp.]|nr:ATP-binding cassette domain-containing protein [Corallococcus sp.]MCM1359552.1 ATP-binding cassette domain-containing protein [Corallococcus sp.]MCM1395144.1 ATP-binding cassette domain-containing protein [Corallococcus sp.]